MQKLLRIWNLISRHKYLITIVAFLLIIGVLDENSLIRRIGHWHEITTLKELTTHPDELEKVAREKYLMKKPNEDIYIFEEDMDIPNRDQE